MAIKQIDHGSKEYEEMIKLRNEVLRKPLGLSFTEDEIQAEVNDILIASFDDEVILGCCLLTIQGNEVVRLRQMAVQKNQQGKGIGETIMQFTENLARDKGFKTLIMHARDTAIGFYEKFGYQIKGDGFVEVNLQHHLMEKSL
jgi:N-acetylglutamate synthase-like GNAT family acetyltransferase